MTLTIRPEADADREAVFAIHARAFPTDAEARLVDALRAAGAAVVSLVAERDGRVVGHVLFSPVRVAMAGDGEIPAIGLAPVAVDPTVQGAGIGGELIRRGLVACRDAGHELVFVLGHPEYYPRLGFEPAVPRGFHYEGGPAFDRAFFVLALAPHAATGRGGVVHYHAAFGSR